MKIIKLIFALAAISSITAAMQRPGSEPTKIYLHNGTNDKVEIYLKAIGDKKFSPEPSFTLEPGQTARDNEAFIIHDPSRIRSATALTGRERQIFNPGNDIVEIKGAYPEHITNSPIGINMQPLKDKIGECQRRGDSVVGILESGFAGIGFSIKAQCKASFDAELEEFSLLEKSEGITLREYIKKEPDSFRKAAQGIILNLSNKNLISIDGLQNIKGIESIKYVDLSNNKLNERIEIEKMLAAIPAGNINLSGNPLSIATIEKLRKEFKNKIIIF